MAEDTLVLDRGSFKALSSDTRVGLLKSLLQRRKTASEIASERKIAVQTASEHIEKLAAAGLVRRVEDGRRWVYFELTPKGRAVVSPAGRSFLLLLGLALLCFTAAFWRISMPASAQPSSQENSVDSNAAAATAMPVLAAAPRKVGAGTDNPAGQAANDSRRPPAQASDDFTDTPSPTPLPSVAGGLGGLTPLEEGLAVAGVVLVALSAFLRLRRYA